MADDVGPLYDYDNELSSSANIQEQEASYVAIINAVKAENSGKKVKQLAAQLIPKYFKHFPAQADNALNAQIDLCEEDELGVRVEAVRALPIIAQQPEQFNKIADVLGQLLVTEDHLELENVTNSLLKLLNMNTKETLSVVFNHILTGDETLRSRGMQFLHDKIFAQSTQKLFQAEDVQHLIVDQVKQTLTDVTGKEFKMLMEILQKMPYFETPKGVTELVNIIADQAQLAPPFQADDSEAVDRLVACLSLAAPLFVRGGSAVKFSEFLGSEVLPHFPKIPEKLRYILLKIIADASPHVTGHDSRVLLPAVYNLFQEQVKPAEGKVCYSFVEALLFTVLNLAAKDPGHISHVLGVSIFTGQPSDSIASDADAKLANFKATLDTLEAGNKAYSQQLQQAFKRAEAEAKAGSTSTDADKTAGLSKQAVIAKSIRCTSNISAMISKLREQMNVKTKQFKFFAADVTKGLHLSWKQEPAAPAPSTPKPQGKAPTTTGKFNNNNRKRAADTSTPTLLLPPPNTNTSTASGSTSTPGTTSGPGATAKRPRFENTYVPPAKLAATQSGGGGGNSGANIKGTKGRTIRRWNNNSNAGNANGAGGKKGSRGWGKSKW
eukprot:TRINITY_DN7673_c0_g1::TRINITY_DN7673_c0_g1_i1::g.18493::m.18493 TRINITY_DN7673_c0_g1::TRINITY_DN7673_c0_g1_i1::g.18493  ORF type:complete len:631 (-),score=161.18,sp/Q6Z6S1/API5_ORYSJ/35.48/5e-90,API5/PF05918.6/1.8e-107 TRINITY_DN7673_c0_g1_i1:22-1845(-)